MAAQQRSSAAAQPLPAPLKWGVTEMDEQGNIAKHVVLTDIIGAEDHFGDMDFKIAGTEEGITAVQLDIKCPWLPLHVLAEALEPAAVAKGKIIETIREATAVASEKDGIPVRQLLVLPKPSHAGFIIGSGGAKKAELEAELGVQINVARRDATEARGIVEIVADSKEKMATAV